VNEIIKRHNPTRPRDVCVKLLTRYTLVCCTLATLPQLWRNKYIMPFNGILCFWHANAPTVARTTETQMQAHACTPPKQLTSNICNNQFVHWAVQMGVSCAV